MRILTISIALSALIGCAPTQQELAARDAQHDRQCRSISATPGTDAYTNCRLQLVQIEAAAAQAASERRQRAAAIMGQGLQNFGRSYSNAYRPPLNCTSYRTGGQVNTTCY